MTKLKDLDTVANKNPIPIARLMFDISEHQAIPYLPAGQVGTIVSVYEGEPPQYLIEFADLKGREYAMAVLKPDEVLAIRYELNAVAFESQPA